MNCPHCNAPNDPEHQFCLNCGKPLTKNLSEIPNPPPPLARSNSELLGVLTLRTILVLLAFWLIKSILLRLPFTGQIRIPDIPISVPTLINSLTYLAVIIVLFMFVQILRTLWPKSYPKYKDFLPIILAVVYLFIFVAVYYAFLPIFTEWLREPDALLIFEVVLFILAFALLIWAAIKLYQGFPYWIANLRRSSYFSPLTDQVVCLNCGRPNQAISRYCSHCGKELPVEPK